MSEVPGSASFDEDKTVDSKPSNYGGGMSASENRMANFRGKTIGTMAAPSVADNGKDTTGAAKNKMAGGGLFTTPVSPCADAQSRTCGDKDDK